jgi:hypothetical protein
MLKNISNMAFRPTALRGAGAAGMFNKNNGLLPERPVRAAPAIIQRRVPGPDHRIPADARGASANAF